MYRQIYGHFGVFIYQTQTLGKRKAVGRKNMECFFVFIPLFLDPSA